MPELVCDTSALQYLYQLQLFQILPVLSDRVVVPTAVVRELAQGQLAGITVPDPTQFDWIVIRSPADTLSVPHTRDLGSGEIEVLALTSESKGAVAVLDDRLARNLAHELGLPFTGTLGLLVDAKRKGLIPLLEPVLDQLQSMRFRVSPTTRMAILKMADEVK